jgi:hypothetical protein
MSLAIDNPASCKIHTYQLLRDKIMNAAEIHRELCAAVYGQNVLSDGSVRQWCGMFKDVQAKKCSR